MISVSFARNYSSWQTRVFIYNIYHVHVDCVWSEGTCKRFLKKNSLHVSCIQPRYRKQVFRRISMGSNLSRTCVDIAFERYPCTRSTCMVFRRYCAEWTHYTLQQRAVPRLNRSGSIVRPAESLFAFMP